MVFTDVGCPLETFLKNHNLLFNMTLNLVSDMAPSDKKPTTWLTVKLNQPMLPYLLHPFAINDTEFVVISHDPETTAVISHRFNVNGDRAVLSRWEQGLPLWHMSESVAYDSKSKRAYIVDNTQGRGVAVTDVETGAVTTRILGQSMSIGYFQPRGSLLVVDGELHLFADTVDGRPRHFGFNSEYEVIHNADIGVMESGKDHGRFGKQRIIYTESALYSETRNSIILCGWNQKGYPIFGEYSLSTRNWDMWQWPGQYTPFRMGAGYVCSANGRYLITFGMDVSLGTVYVPPDGIVVYDLTDHTAERVVSPIRCPALLEYYALLMRDRHREEVLTIAFIKNSFKSKEMEGLQLPPLYLIRMMAQWVEMEWIYLLSKDGESLWKMDMNEILESVI